MTKETEAGVETADRSIKWSKTVSSPEEIQTQTFWQQSEAWILFDLNQQHPPVLDAIAATRSEALRKMNSHPDAWQMGVEMKKEDFGLVSSHQIFNMRQRAVFLIASLERARKNMAKDMTFECVARVL
jgi:hypothetical protein